jgi:hypothetical protein
MNDVVFTRKPGKKMRLRTENVATGREPIRRTRKYAATMPATASTAVAAANDHGSPLEIHRKGWTK